MKFFLIIVYSCLLIQAKAQNIDFQIALVKYGGGGDWYANLATSLPNLIRFVNQNLGTSIDEKQAIVELSSTEIFQYPFLHLTGHGNVIFSPAEVNNLRKYLLNGGFLHIDDNYGLDTYIRREMKKVFPELDFVLLPKNHPIYHQTFKFPNGLPKIHEHNNLPPQGLGLFFDNRLICFYTHESDLGDGWEDQAVHQDPWLVREKALKMGSNILEYVFMGE